MKRFSVILCVLVVFGLGKVGAQSPCAGPAAISGLDTVCAGAVIALNDTSLGGTWSSSDTDIATVGEYTGVVTGKLGGSVTITYLLSAGCYAIKPVYVRALLPITGSTAICVASSGIFSDLTIGGTWNSSNTTVATINSSTGAANAITPGNTIITYTLANGCSTRVILTVNPLPPNYYVFGGGNYCAGTSGATIGLNGSDVGINYMLYNGSTFVDSLHGTGSTLYYGPYTATGTYQIYGVNITTHCSNRMSGIATIGVIPDNVPSVTISTPTGDTVCLLASTTFTATPVNAGASPSYQWFVNGTGVGTSNTYSYIPTEGDEVSVILYSDAVCAIPSTATDEMTMTTIPKVTPSVSISVIPGDTVCEFVPVTIIPAPVYGGASPNYRWIKNGLTAYIGAVYNYLPMNGDNILCSIYSNYHCLIVDSAYSTNNINMTVMPLLIPTVTVTAHPGTRLGVGERDTLIATVINGGTSLAYQWNINGIVVPGATRDTLVDSTFANNDTVTCVVTSSSFCGGTPASAYVVITDTVADTITTAALNHAASSDNKITIAPNPNRGVFTISGVFTADNTEVAIDITDMLGQTMYTRVVPLQKGRLNAPINAGDLANGVYSIRTRAGNTRVVNRVVVSR